MSDSMAIAHIGTYISGAAKVSIPINNRAHMAQVTPANTYPGLTKPGKGEQGEPDKYYPNGKRNYTRVVPADDLQGSAGANWAKELGVTSVFILDDTELYGKGIADVFEAKAKEIGLNVVGREGIDGKAADYRALAAKILDLNPDLVYYGGITQNNAGQLWKDIKGEGYQGKMMGPDGIYETARQCVACLLDPTIAAWVSPDPELPQFLPERHVLSPDTLYLLSKDGGGSAETTQT